MAEKYTVQLSSSFDYKEVLDGLDKIKKQASSIHIGDEIAKNLQKSLSKLDIKLPKLNTYLNKDALDEKQLEKFKKVIEEVIKEYEKIYIIASSPEFTQAFSKIDLEKLKDLDKQLNTIQNSVSKVRDSLVKEFNKNTFTSDNSIVQQAITQLFNVNPGEVKNKFKEIETDVKSQMALTEERLREYSNSINSKTSGLSILKFLYGEDTQTSVVSGQLTNFRDEFKRIITEIQQAAPASQEAKKALKDLTDLLNNEEIIKNPYREKLFNLPTQEDLKALSELKTYLGEIINLLKNKKQFFDDKDVEATNALAEKTQILTDRTEDVTEAQKELQKVTKNTIGSASELNDEATEGLENAKEARISAQALDAAFGGLISRITNTVSALTVFNKSMQIVRQAVNSVKELDAAFTQIAIVSEQSSEQAWAMFDRFNSLAKQYSITTKDLTEGAKLFYQQGLNAADTMKMVEASTVSAALGEVTMTDAANTLTAAIQGYNESAAVAMDYTDKIAQVGAVSAADFHELSAAMEKTASSAYTAGISFDSLLGYLGKMVEVTREAPIFVGIL